MASKWQLIFKKLQKSPRDWRLCPHIFMASGGLGDPPPGPQLQDPDKLKLWIQNISLNQTFSTMSFRKEV